MIDTGALRSKILDLAIQGKLVPQVEGDIEAEKTVSALSLELNGKQYKRHMTTEEMPFSIPFNWCWCKLSDIGTTNIGLTYHPGDIIEDGTIVLRSNNITNWKMDYTDLVRVDCTIKDSQYLDNTDILICARNGSKALVGKCAIYEGAPKKVSFGAFMAVYRTRFFKYVYYYFQTSAFRRYFSNDDTKQINQVTQSILKNSLIPIPPIEEQKRIIAKVDEAFRLLDEIDALQSKYQSDVAALKSKIIDAGIRGQLTEQLPEDGTAEELYQAIQAEKAQLIKEKKIKKEKPLPEITADEIPFEIPENWKWVRLGNITYNYGQKLPQNRFCYIDVGTLDNVHHKLNTKNKIIEAKDAPSRARKVVEMGDVIYSTVRPYLHNICIIDRDFPYEPIASTAFAVMHMPNGVTNKYLLYWLLSKWFDRYANGDSTKGTLYPAIGEKDFFKGLCPLPPLSEQKRIVAKIDEVLSALDKRDRL